MIEFDSKKLLEMHLDTIGKHIKSLIPIIECEEDGHGDGDALIRHVFVAISSFYYAFKSTPVSKLEEAFEHWMEPMEFTKDLCSVLAHLRVVQDPREKLFRAFINNFRNTVEAIEMAIVMNMSAKEDEDFNPTEIESTND